MEYDKLLANNKRRFIQMQLDGQLTVQKKDILEVNRELRALNFTPQAVLTKMIDDLEANIRSIVVQEEGEEELTKEKEEEQREGEFD